MTTTRSIIDNNDQRTLTIFHAPYAIGGYRSFLVWEPMRHHWAIDVVLIDGKTYHCHPAISGSQLDGFQDEFGNSLESLLHDFAGLSEMVFGEDRPGVTISPVRWSDNHIDSDRWHNLHLPEFINVRICQPGR